MLGGCYRVPGVNSLNCTVFSKHLPHLVSFCSIFGLCCSIFNNFAHFLISKQRHGWCRYLSLTARTIRCAGAFLSKSMTLSVDMPIRFCPLICKIWSPKRSPASAAGVALPTNCTNTPCKAAELTTCHTQAGCIPPAVSPPAAPTVLRLIGAEIKLTSAELC